MPPAVTAAARCTATEAQVDLLVKELAKLKEEGAAAAAAVPPAAAPDAEAMVEEDILPDEDGLLPVTMEARLKHQLMLVEAQVAGLVKRFLNAFGKVEKLAALDHIMTFMKVLNIEDPGLMGAIAPMADSADKQAALTRYADTLLGAAPLGLAGVSNKDLRTALRELFLCALYVRDHDAIGDSAPGRVFTITHFAAQSAKVLNMYGDAPRVDQVANKAALSFMHSSMDGGAWPQSEYALIQYMVTGARDGLREEKSSNHIPDGGKAPKLRLAPPKTRTFTKPREVRDALEVFLTSVRFLQADDVAGPGKRHGQVGAHPRIPTGSFLNVNLHTVNRVLDEFTFAVDRGVALSPISDIVDDLFQHLRADTRPPVNKTINFALDGRLGQVKDSLRSAVFTSPSKAALAPPDTTVVRDLRRELSESKRALSAAKGSPNKKLKATPSATPPKGAGRAEGTLGPNKLATGLFSPRVRGGNPDAPDSCHNKSCGANAICSFSHKDKA